MSLYVTVCHCTTTLNISIVPIYSLFTSPSISIYINLLSIKITCITCTTCIIPAPPHAPPPWRHFSFFLLSFLRSFRLSDFRPSDSRWGLTRTPSKRSVLVASGRLLSLSLSGGVCYCLLTALRLLQTATSASRTGSHHFTFTLRYSLSTLSIRENCLSGRHGPRHGFQHGQCQYAASQGHYQRPASPGPLPGYVCLHPTATPQI